MPDLRRKVTPEQEVEIVDLATKHSRAELSYTDLAVRFGVSPSAIGRIVRKHRQAEHEATAAEVERARLTLLAAQETE